MYFKYFKILVVLLRLQYAMTPVQINCSNITITNLNNLTECSFLLPNLIIIWFTFNMELICFLLVQFW